MKFFKYLLVISITVLLILGCVYGFSLVSCEGSEDKIETETAEVLSVTVLSDELVVEDAPDEEDETADVKQWVKVTFDVAVIAMSVGVMGAPYGPQNAS